MPCPECGEVQRIEWKQILWEVDEDSGKVDPKSVAMVCRGCGVLIPESRKGWMLERGAWVAERPELSRTWRSFHLSALYSPLGWYSWVDAANDFLRAKGNPQLLRGWVNTVLGETWKEKGEAPEWQQLYRRRERYPIGEVPRGGVLLTAGVDVQADRLEIEVVAWGKGKESWSVEYLVIQGDTAAPAPWEELSKLVGRTWIHASGAQMPLAKVAIDSGFRTNTVYGWVRGQRPMQCLAIKGRATLPVLVGQPRAMEVNERGRRLRRGIKVWTVGVDVAKSELYGWLRQDPPTYPERDGFPPGWCHFPRYEEEYFKQLTAEEIVVKHQRGYRRYVWQCTRPNGRNEALDCRVYARAAAAVAGIDRWSDEDWNRLAAELGSEGKAARIERVTQGRASEGGRRRRDGGWLGGRRKGGSWL